MTHVTRFGWKGQRVTRPRTPTRCSVGAGDQTTCHALHSTGGKAGGHPGGPATPPREEAGATLASQSRREREGSCRGYVGVTRRGGAFLRTRSPPRVRQGEPARTAGRHGSPPSSSGTPGPQSGRSGTYREYKSARRRAPQLTKVKRTPHSKGYPSHPGAQSPGQTMTTSARCPCTCPTAARGRQGTPALLGTCRKQDSQLGAHWSVGSAGRSRRTYQPLFNPSHMHESSPGAP